MKVVFFCGGLGSRLREYTETVPKSMVVIGDRPILWHLMQYYAHFGHNEFILCLGYKGHIIKQYFVDQVQLAGGSVCEDLVTLKQEEGNDWQIRLVETGLESNIAQRLCLVRPFLTSESVFMANYSDGLSDLPLNDYIDYFHKNDAIASFASVKPTNSFHAVSMDANNLVDDICPANESDFWINGGFFILRENIFSYIKEGEELVEAPFKRLISKQKLLAYPHTGFWACMDTLKDKIIFDKLVTEKLKYWRVWWR
ncbi:sugar phosphate nucleotidyltransferase [Paraglaciecola sp. L3A3]|uniref:sugar phosphate nucleotidyltransferase n=1 Tax=Paraglaciecola sp. L3A3 TaxID=2686358 RepID=UPI00131D5EDA|nr:sugar phosphate nucleotidyltransferase [Paraglaciecola sp. L3A3]